MKLLAAAAAAVTGIQVGSAMVATRIVVDQAGPASLALLRYAISFCCLVPFVLVAAPRARFARRDLLPIGLLGIAQFGLLIALLNYGLRFIPSARAAGSPSCSSARAAASATISGSGRSNTRAPPR